MDRVNNFLTNKLMPFAGKVAAQKHLAALRDGMILAMPFLIIGSVFLILANFPITAYLDFMNAHPEIKASLLYPYRGTFDLVALIALIGVAYRLAESYKVDPLASAAVALAAFFVVTPSGSFTVGDASISAMETAFFTSKGLFVGLLTALITTEIYRRLVQKNIVIKMPEGVPTSVAKSFTALIPGFCAIVTVWLIRLAIEQFSNFGNIHNVVAILLQQPLTAIGTSLVGTIIIFILINLLWSTGLHGASIVGAIMTPIWLQLTNENAVSIQNGEPVEHIVTNEFNDLMLIGGSGSTLALIVAMLLFSKSKQMKQLGKLSIGPGMFNINEPVLFGMPIVLNPIMLIPFLITPVATVLITYLSMDLGLVAKPIGVVAPWTMPPFIQGYLLTGSISGTILQLVLFATSFCIYFPFFKVWDKQKFLEETKTEADTDAVSGTDLKKHTS